MPPSMALGRPILNPSAENGHALTVRSVGDGITSLFARDNDSDLPSDADGSDSMINLMLSVLGIVFFSLVLVSMLFVFRRARRLQRIRNQGLPVYHDAKNPSAAASSNTINHRGLTIETKHNGRSSIYVIGRDGQPMLQNPNSAPDSPDNVPEIHITFPDEHDDQGRQTGGRVLVVRVGENATVGLEPMQDEQLPAYEKEAKGQFHSINMDHIGGLKEKDRTVFQ